MFTRVPLPPVKPKSTVKGGHKDLSWNMYLQSQTYKFRMGCYNVVMWDRSGRGMGATFDAFISVFVMCNIAVMGTCILNV